MSPARVLQGVTTLMAPRLIQMERWRNTISTHSLSLSALPCFVTWLGCAGFSLYFTADFIANLEVLCLFISFVRINVMELKVGLSFCGRCVHDRLNMSGFSFCKKIIDKWIKCFEVPLIPSGRWAGSDRGCGLSQGH